MYVILSAAVANDCLGLVFKAYNIYIIIITVMQSEALDQVHVSGFTLSAGI